MKPHKLHKLHKSLLVLFLLGVFRGEAAAQRFEERRPLKMNGRLSIKTHKGSVKLKGWDQPQVEVRAFIEADPSVDPDYARRSIEAVRIELEGDAEELSIKTNYKDVPCVGAGFMGCSQILPLVHYQISAPESLRLRLKDHKSDIELHDLGGELHLSTHKGQVRADGLLGRIKLSTHKGEVKLRGVTGKLELGTHKGNIEAEEVKITEDSALRTHKGRISLRLASGAKLDVRMKMGRRAKLKLPERALLGDGPRLDIKSHRGEIELALK